MFTLEQTKTRESSTRERTLIKLLQQPNDNLIKLVL